ncbi:MAG: porin family protein [Paludibacteraceae bacterium]
MKIKLTIFSMLLLMSASTFGQIGIRAGVNMAQEIQSFDSEDIATAFHSDNLTGYQIGLIYQMNPKKSGLGFEIGALLSQKGGVFRFDSTGVVNSFVKGYREINCIDVPMSVRLRIDIGGVIGVFGTAGVYGSYALQGKTVYEGLAEISREENFGNFMERLDYGYSIGYGVELIRKLQISAKYSQGLQKRDTSKSILDIVNTESGGTPNVMATNTSKVFSVTLTYLF